MNDIADFEKEYRAQLDSAIADAGMPPALLEQFSFDSCIRKDKDGKKELYLITRKEDGAKGLLRITFHYPEEDALEEAKLLNLLDHPAIPKVYATYEQAERKYIVREYIEGRSLYDVVRTNGTMSPKDIYGVALKLCDVLGYLHSLMPPVIHRDIKPQNIIIAPDGSVHLIDFGIARIHKPGQQQDTSIILTGRYAPPEQFGYDQTSPLTDIYSLGVVMLFMATGHEEKTGLDLQIKDKTLRRLIERCIAFDPKARFQSVQSITQYIKRNTGEKKNRRRLLLVLLLVAIVTCSAIPFYYVGYHAGDAAGHETGYQSGFDEGYSAGYDNAPGLGLLETPYNSAYGNLPGNLTSGDAGFAVRSENEIYYLLYDGIYSMEPLTAQTQLLVETKDAFCLNYYDGWLYYSTKIDIRRVLVATGETEVFCSDISGQIHIIDGQFYVRNATDSLCLYQVSADGQEAVKLNDLTHYFYLNIVDGRMYFAYHDDERKLYSCNLDGSDLKIVYDGTCEWICAYEDQIYCFNVGENGGWLMRMDLNGGNVERLLRDVTNYTNVTPGGIFYTRGNESTLEWMSFDGRTRYTISPNKAGLFNIVGDWIFYINKDDNDALWRVRIDGTDNYRVE